MEETVDALFFYVNSEDPEWLKEFNKYNTMSRDIQNGYIRYHDSGTLKLAIESVKKFAPWISDIYLVVMSESQIPSYIDDSIKIVYHRNFIPEKYLPSFNICAMEIFLPFIPNISDRFIYFNDDMILTSPVETSIFFDKNGNPYSTVKYDEVKAHENPVLLNTFNLVMNTNQGINEICTIHGPAAFRKDWMLDCYKKFKEKFLENLSPLRRSENDYSQYAYQFYQFIYKQAEYNEFKWKSFGKNVKLYEKFDWDTLGQYVGICMNDTQNGSIEEYVKKVEDYISKQ